MSLCLGIGGSATPSPRPHQDTVVALGLQRVICGHKDGIGFGSLNLGHQFVVLGIETGSKVSKSTLIQEASQSLAASWETIPLE